jgi:hypothetical protein
MDDSGIPHNPRLSAATLRIVRYAMLVGVLLFGALAYYQSRNRAPGDGGADLEALRWVGFTFCAGAIASLVVIRGARRRAAPAARPTLGLIGSAFAEGAALLGAVYMLLGGDAIVFGLGMLIFLASWTLLPADPEAT